MEGPKEARTCSQLVDKHKYFDANTFLQKYVETGLTGTLILTLICHNSAVCQSINSDVTVDIEVSAIEASVLQFRLLKFRLLKFGYPRFKLKYFRFSFKGTQITWEASCYYPMMHLLKYDTRIL